MTKVRGVRVPLNDQHRADLLAGLPPDVRDQWEEAYDAFRTFEAGSGVSKRLGRGPLRLGDIPGSKRMALKALDLRLVRTAATYSDARGTSGGDRVTSRLEWDSSDMPGGTNEPDTVFHRRGGFRQEPPLLLWLQPDEEARMEISRGGYAFIALFAGVFLVPIIVGAIAFQLAPATNWPVTLATMVVAPLPIYLALMWRARRRARSAPPPEGGHAFMAASLAARARPTLEAAARWALADAGLPPPKALRESSRTPGGGPLNTVFDYNGYHRIGASTIAMWGVEYITFETKPTAPPEAHRKLKGQILEAARSAWRAGSSAAAPPVGERYDPAADGWTVGSLPPERPTAPPFVQAELAGEPIEDGEVTAHAVAVAVRKTLPRAAPVSAEEPGAWRWSEIGGHTVVTLTARAGEPGRLKVEGSIDPRERDPLLAALALALRGG